MPSASPILYAEDDENDVFFMERAFARLRRTDELRILHTGRDVVEYLTLNGGPVALPSLIVLDIKMQEMSGLEVLAWLRARADFAAVPVVMFTSSTQEKDLEFCRQHGANAYLMKPPSAENLAALMQQVLAAAASGRPGRFALPENLL